MSFEKNAKNKKARNVDSRIKRTKEISQKYNEDLKKFFASGHKEQFLAETKEGYPNKTTVAVAHGHVLLILLTHFGWIDYKDILVSEIKNTAYLKLVLTDGGYTIEEVHGLDC